MAAVLIKSGKLSNAFDNTFSRERNAPTTFNKANNTSYYFIKDELKCKLQSIFNF